MVDRDYKTYEELGPEVGLAMEETNILLSNKLSDIPDVLSMQIADIEAHHYRICDLLADANATLSMARKRELEKVNADGKLNVFSKEIYIEADTVNESTMVERLEKRLRSIEKRIETAQSLLAYEREIAKIGGRETT